jgi:hypothetical protein
MSNPSITYAQRSDATPEAEVSALSNVYRYVIDRVHKNAAGVASTNGDDAMKGSENNGAKTSIP